MRMACDRQSGDKDSVPFLVAPENRIRVEFLFLLGLRFCDRPGRLIMAVDKLLVKGLV